MRPTTSTESPPRRPIDDGPGAVGAGHSRQKTVISLCCAGALLLALLCFSLALRFEQSLLSLFLFHGMSVYLALMLALTLGFWGLTWLYVTLVERVDHRSKGEQA